MITCLPKIAMSSLFILILYIVAKTSTTVFEGDPSGSPDKNYMAVISDRNYTI